MSRPISAGSAGSNDPASEEPTPEQRLRQLKRELAPHQIAEFRNSFDFFDKNNDGTITLKELHTAYNQLGQYPTTEELREMIKDVDRDGSGEVDWLEFLTLMARAVAAESETDDEVRAAFRHFDADGKGGVSASEVRAVMEQYGETFTTDEIQEMLNDICTDGSGCLNLTDFVTLYKTPAIKS
eukprot:TRINITY_DN9378_c0_g1_i1.p1 TRINITY_DN9378_c0_g1~~TRINITY_DN9378_c0_g1_i1.p1  ORF type:complete len:183 (+),score=57.00 TRINITY_DN9378_c0_g1_i1:86-634(+)